MKPTLHPSPEKGSKDVYLTEIIKRGLRIVFKLIHSLNQP